MHRVERTSYLIPLGGHWRRFTEKRLSAVRTRDNRLYRSLDKHIGDFQRNPLSYALMHGNPRDDEHGNDGVAFVNDWEHDLTFLLAGNQYGKAVPCDSCVYTPEGLKRIGDICVGDRVYGMDGKPTTVTGVHPQGKMQTYAVSFDNSEVFAVCTEDHLWTYLRHHRGFKRTTRLTENGQYRKFEVLSLRDIIKAQGMDGDNFRVGYVPATEPVDFPYANHGIHPYIMGAILGDGCFRTHNPTFTTADPEIADRIQSVCSGVSLVRVPSSKCGYAFVGRTPGNNIMRGELKNLGLWMEKSEGKFIPESYKYDGVENRIELLRGLMDTDGTIGDMVRVEFYSVSQRLANDVAFLVRSLGGKARISTKKSHYTGKDGTRVHCQLCYRVAVKLHDINPFFLPRKAKKFRRVKRRKDRILGRIDKLGKEECVCITVDNDSGTFLLEDFIVTHNSFAGAVWAGMRIIKCDPAWPCFADHGLICPEWTGPKDIIIASSEWTNVETVWNTYLKVLPRAELGVYAPGYGDFPGEDAKHAKRFNSKQGMTTIPLQESGSRAILMAYSQTIAAWGGRQCNLAHTDEQCPENHMDELMQRQTTMGDYTPICGTLTGHVVDGRADTGAGGWIKRKVIDRGNTKGRKVATYKISMEDVPDAIISPETKREKYIQWVEEPGAMNDDKKIREGVARYYGGWEVGGGLVIGAWNKEIHVIPDFDVLAYNPCLYRMIDYGESPCAAALFALMKWGDVVLFKEYYEFGRSIRANAIGIVEELCGNKRRVFDSHEFEEQQWKIFQEVTEGGLKFVSSEMDGRSYAHKLQESGRTIGRAYNNYGCQCHASANDGGARSDRRGLVDLLNDHFGLVKGRPHICSHVGLPVPEASARFGSPRMYVLESCRNTIGEIDGWSMNPKTNKPRDENDHLISCCKFYTARERRYRAESAHGYRRDWVKEPLQKVKRDRFTGHVIRG